MSVRFLDTSQKKKKNRKPRVAHDVMFTFTSVNNIQYILHNSNATKKSFEIRRCSKNYGGFNYEKLLFRKFSPC